MKIQGKYFLYAFIIIILNWLIWFIFSVKTDNMHIVFKAIICILKGAVIVFIGVVLLTAGEMFLDNLPQIWKNIEKWCDNNLTIGNDKE